MINAGIASLLLIVICTMIHNAVLCRLRLTISAMPFIPRRGKLFVAVMGAMFSHLLQISVFAIAYYLLRDKFGLGIFGGDFEDTFSSFLYFSTETYTSLGFGDIYPMGALRMLTGIEALVGLVMIGWTASFTYLEMTQYWSDAKENGRAGHES